MKIVYGNSPQKSIERSQRITNRERKKRREKRFPAPEQSSQAISDSIINKKKHEKAQPKERIHEEPFFDNPKSIPHEISLIHTEFPDNSFELSDDAQIMKKTSKGVWENETEYQSTATAAQSSPQAAQTSPAATPVGLGMGMETESAPASTSDESTATNYSSDWQSDNEPNLSGFSGRSRRVKNSVISAEKDQTATVPLSSVPLNSTCCSSSPEGKILMKRLQQLLQTETDLYEILLPSGSCPKKPIVIFLHEENLSDC